jgi:hypothetical protein
MRVLSIGVWRSNTHVGSVKLLSGHFVAVSLESDILTALCCCLSPVVLHLMSQLRCERTCLRTAKLLALLDAFIILLADSAALLFV